MNNYKPKNQTIEDITYIVITPVRNEEDHLAAVAWNALACIETEHRIELGILPKELDDLSELRATLRGEKNEQTQK